jgi:hypothetical protein
MPSQFGPLALLSPNGALMPPNGRPAKSRRREFAEWPDEAVEQYVGARVRSLQCDAHIHRTGAKP